MRSHFALQPVALAVFGLASTVPATGSFAQTATPAAMVSAEAALTPAQHLLSDTWSAKIGVFVLTTNFDGSLAGTAQAAGTSQDVNFDREFGTNENASRVRADVVWRFLPRHHLRLLYFDNDVSRTRTLGEDVEWGDYTFLRGSKVTADYKFAVYELAYEYAFLRSPNLEVVGTAGVHYADISIRLSGNATVVLPDGTVQAATFQTKQSSLPAPLPVVGLSGAWAVAPRWNVDANAQVFNCKIGAYDGSWWDLRVGATWMYNNHVGIGAGWNKFTTHVDVDRTNFHGRANTGYTGLVLYVTGVL